MTLDYLKGPFEGKMFYKSFSYPAPSKRAPRRKPRRRRPPWGGAGPCGRGSEWIRSGAASGRKRIHYRLKCIWKRGNLNLTEAPSGSPITNLQHGGAGHAVMQPENNTIKKNTLDQDTVKDQWQCLSSSKVYKVWPGSVSIVKPD